MALARPRLFSLAWPLFVELLLGIGVGVVGTVLAARLSDDSGAAFALANHVAGTLFILFRLIAVGVSVVITQSLGGGRRDQADAVARASLGASSWLGGVAALAALVFSAPLLRLLNAPEQGVLPLAMPLLQWLAPAVMLDAWNASMASVMRAHMRTRDTLAVIVAMQLATLAVAVPLMPRLGLPGFAIALIAARSLGLLLHVLLWRARLGLRPAAADWWQLRRQELKAILHIGLPGAAENIAYRLAYMVSVAAAGQMGAMALATQTYVSQLMYGVMLFSVATGLAVEIMVGHMIGAGHLHEAHKLVRRALAAGIAVSSSVAALAALFGRPLVGLFTQDAHILALGATLLWWTVLIEPGRVFNVVVINALRAAGDARFPVAAGAASMLIVLAGGSWFLGVHLGLGLVGVWIAYAADEWLRGLMMWWRWSSHGWVPHARAVHRRVNRAEPS